MVKSYPPYEDININTTHSRKDDNEWQDWSPIWSKEKNTPHSLQENHSPTKNIDKNNNLKRRITDIRIWKSMSPEQQDASIEIAKTFESLTKGIGYSSMKFENNIRATSPINISELQAELMVLYMDWGRKCTERNISHSVIIDILCFGMSCSQSDAFRKTRKGDSKSNLLKGLQIYCEIKGWCRKK